jgi:ribokinase
VTERNGVTVVGSVHTDLIASADAMPAPGSSVLGTRFTLAPGGKAGNQAAQLALLGIPTWLVARIGIDPLGDVIADQLQSAGVDLAWLARTSDTPTGASTVFAVDGEYASIIVPGAAGLLSAADLDAASGAVRRSRYVLTQLELGPNLAIAALSLARSAGATTVLNASPIGGVDPESLTNVLDMTDVLVVNRHEAALIAGMQVPDRAAAVAAARQLVARYGIQTVVVTCGADGAVLARDSTVVEQGAVPVAVVDTVGAGDAFLGALVASWMQGQDDQQALRVAAAAGAVAASGPGAFTSLPDRLAVEALLSDRA